MASTNLEDWKTYFAFLYKLAKCLGELTELEREKITAINYGDLELIDDIMKDEQVHSMNLKGMEQRRVRLLQILAVPPGKLDELPQYIPAALQSEGKRVIDIVKLNYKMYQETSDIARKNLEAGLRQLQSISGIPMTQDMNLSQIQKNRAMDKETKRRGVTPVASSLDVRARGMSLPSLTQNHENHETYERSRGRQDGYYGQYEGETPYRDENPLQMEKAYNQESAVPEQTPVYRTKETGGGEEPTTSQERESYGNSRMSDYIRRKKEAAGHGNGEVNPSDVPLPPPNVMDSLRKQFAEQREGTTSVVCPSVVESLTGDEDDSYLSGSSAVNLRSQLRNQGMENPSHNALRKQAEEQRGEFPR